MTKIVLGIESSCDETACALVNDKREVLASVVWSQYDEHRRFGGVVPEIAARAHLEKEHSEIKPKEPPKMSRILAWIRGGERKG